MEINDKVAIVTGGAGGIGAAIAGQLVNEGARVAIADISLERASAVAMALGQANAMSIGLDVTDAESCRAARRDIEQRFGPCDILVSNAGVGFTGTIETIDPAAWRWVYDVNVVGSLNMIQTFVPAMRAGGKPSHVVLTCSITALHPFATQAAYTSSKAALLNMATVLKSELAGAAIGVTAVCPGIVATNLRDNAVAARPPALDASTPPPGLSTQHGMAPSYIGKAIVEAIGNDSFYLFTHADYAAPIKSEWDAMLRAMQRSADPDYHEPSAFLGPLPR